MSRRSSGSLNLVGIGYMAAGHITSEALALIQSADRLFFLVYDPVHENWLRSLNPNAVSLADCAQEGMWITDCSNAMAQQIVLAVRKNLNVCAAFSGHPGIAVSPAYEALRLAKANGYRTKMFPAVSAMDCLFADLGVDPANGCQFFEA